MTTAVAKQFRSPSGAAWCHDHWYVSVTDYDTGKIFYLRNDCISFPKMHRNHLDPNGGTYYKSQHDAQQLADRYNASQNETDQDNTNQITDQTPHIPE